MGAQSAIFVPLKYALPPPQLRSEELICGNACTEASTCVANLRGTVSGGVLRNTALLNAVVAIYIFTLVPEFLMRFLVWMLISALYRVRVRARIGVEIDAPVSGDAATAAALGAQVRALRGEDR